MMIKSQRTLQNKSKFLKNLLQAIANTIYMINVQFEALIVFCIYATRNVFEKNYLLYLHM